MTPKEVMWKGRMDVLATYARMARNNGESIVERLERDIAEVQGERETALEIHRYEQAANWDSLLAELENMLEGAGEAMDLMKELEAKLASMKK